MHVCHCAAWTVNGLEDPTKGGQGALTLGKQQDVSGTLATPTQFDFAKVVGGAFQKPTPPAVYFPDGKAARVTGDIGVTLPVPDEVYLGGPLTDGMVVDASGAKKNMMPYVATVLKYLRPAQGTFGLNVTIPNYPKLGINTTFTVSPGEDLLFRMMHVAECAVGSDIDHAQMAFGDLQSRITVGGNPTGLTLKLNSVAFSQNSQPDGIDDNELGLGFAFPACPSPAPGIVRIHNNTLANCAGGGGAVGG
ncbi:MAG: hypothetical protein M3O31_03865 [Acidobacteriota bacterium]|nr:hypothetical protein [Acidobacteriota bacterium]